MLANTDLWLYPCYAKADEGRGLMEGFTMRAKRTLPKRLGYSIIDPDGRIVLPVQIQDFEVGQRVFFHIRGNGVVITARPQQAIRGRFLSCRVRRAVRSFSTYGPRATQSSSGKEANQGQLRARKMTQTKAAIDCANC